MKKVFLNSLVIVATITVTALAGCGKKQVGVNETAITAPASAVERNVGEGGHFNPNIDYGSFTDSRDGKTYRTVRIGSLTWMAENLNYQSENSRCYDDDESHCAAYGRLYSGSAPCPDGWRLPSCENWHALIQVTGGGDRLKSQTGWDVGVDEDGDKFDYNGTDDYGFSALPGGSGYCDYVIDEDDDSDGCSFYGVGADGSWRWNIEYNGSGDGDAVGGTLEGQFSGGRGKTWLSARCIQGMSLTVHPDPADGGTVTPPSELGFGTDTTVTIAATAAENFRFAGWVVINECGDSDDDGDEPAARIADPNSATTTVALSGDAKIQALFHLLPPEPGSQFNPNINHGSFTDSRDGKTYRTVEIGSQTWMAENLNFVTDNSWCLNDDDANCAVYGRLYDWNAAMSACPAEWHLPDTADWNALARAVGGQPGNPPRFWSIAGGKLKSKIGWRNRDDGSSGNGTDDYGFSALPGGSRRYGENSNNDYGSWWSATDTRTGGMWKRWIRRDDEYLYMSTDFSNVGNSVRCVR